MRPHEEAEAKMIIAGGFLIVGLSLPLLRPPHILGSILLASGVGFIAFGFVHLRRL